MNRLMNISTVKALKIELNKRGITTSLQQLSVQLGYSASYLKQSYSREGGIKKYVLHHLESLLRLTDAKIILDEIGMSRIQHMYKLEATLKEKGSLIYSHESHYISAPLSFTKKDVELGLYSKGEYDLLWDALGVIVLAFRIDYSTIDTLTITRIDTKQEKQELTRKLIFTE